MGWEKRERFYLYTEYEIDEVIEWLSAANNTDSIQDVRNYLNHAVIILTEKHEYEKGMSNREKRDAQNP